MKNLTYAVFASIFLLCACTSCKEKKATTLTPQDLMNSFQQNYDATLGYPLVGDTTLKVLLRPENCLIEEVASFGKHKIFHIKSYQLPGHGLLLVDSTEEEQPVFFSPLVFNPYGVFISENYQIFTEETYHLSMMTNIIDSQYVNNLMLIDSLFYQYGRCGMEYKTHSAKNRFASLDDLLSWLNFAVDKKLIKRIVNKNDYTYADINRNYFCYLYGDICQIFVLSTPIYGVKANRYRVEMYSIR